MSWQARSLALCHGLCLLFLCSSSVRAYLDPWQETERIQSRGDDLYDGRQIGKTKVKHDGNSILLPSTTEAAPGLPVFAYNYSLHGQNHTLTLPFDPLAEMRTTLATMQDHFFEIWLGQWPDAIDWTAALMGTYLSSCITTLARETLSADIAADADNETQRSGQQMMGRWMDLDNEMNKYFSHTLSYYFAENAFDIRNEAHDDMLWVVLGWLESIKFMHLRSSLPLPLPFSFPSPASSPTNIAAGNTKTSTGSGSGSWYGTQFLPAFAHRAHIFYALVRPAWDASTCGGGISWNRNLAPYKNTITNTLYITASVSMYLHHPGDENSSPFLASSGMGGMGGMGTSSAIPPAHAHDRRYLEAAIETYEWLKEVNLTTAEGLYVDGYHIREWQHGGKECDERNEALYTYNQGVLLSGLRDLWEATGETEYLWDAHQLVHSVVSATGWDIETNTALIDNDGNEQHASFPLGTHGILKERCDASGSCNQDEQSFKGIFFHHLAALCLPLPRTNAEARVPGLTFLASLDTATRHAEHCKSYIGWVAGNAVAAMGTRDGEGVVGGWWGVGMEGRGGKGMEDGQPGMEDEEERGSHDQQQRPLIGAKAESVRDTDPNDRGRGRTLETHSAGLMVVRTLWELVKAYGEVG